MELYSHFLKKKREVITCEDEKELDKVTNYTVSLKEGKNSGIAPVFIKDIEICSNPICSMINELLCVIFNNILV